MIRRTILIGAATLMCAIPAAAQERGTVEFDWGWIKFVPAWHTNTLPDGTAIGNPAGMLINLGGKTPGGASDHGTVGCAAL